jgi:hypothetical protein
MVVPLLSAVLGESSAIPGSQEHCLRIEYNPEAVAPEDPKLNGCSAMLLVD